LRDSASFAYAFAFALSLLFLIGLPANSSFFENSFVYFPVNEYIIRTKNKPDELSMLSNTPTGMFKMLHANSLPVGRQACVSSNLPNERNNLNT
jgi:hypothetical protein